MRVGDERSEFINQFLLYRTIQSPTCGPIGVDDFFSTERRLKLLIDSDNIVAERCKVFFEWCAYAICCNHDDDFGLQMYAFFKKLCCTGA